MLINMRKVLRISALALSSIVISNSGIAVADSIKNMNKPVEYSILADLNKDGELNYKDYTTIEDFILGKIDLMPYNERFGLFELGDLNGDFDITSTDQAILNRYLNGMINNFEVEEKIIEYIADKTILLYEGQELKFPETIKATMYNNSKKDMQVTWDVKDLNFNSVGEYKVTGIVNGYNKEVNLNVIVNDYNPNSNVISGVVDGIEKGDKAIITIGNDSYLKTIETDERGIYQLNDVPNGEYFVKIDLSGYKLQQTKNVTVYNNTGTTKGNTYSNVGQANFEVEEFTDNQYKYHWEQDDTVGGYEESANIVNRPKIEFLDKEVVVGDSNSANKLLHNYNIILSDE